MKKFSTHAIRAILSFPLFLLLFILGINLNSNAQSVTISALLRPRFEIEYGYKVPPDTGSTPKYLLSQRTRLNAAYNSARFNAFVSFQDARIWGDENQGVDLPSIGLHEAWAEYNFCKQVALKIGRQEFKYDNKRLLTDGDWPQQGRAHDAAVLKVSLDGGWKIHAAGSFNQNTNNYFNTYYSPDNYKTLDFLWLNKSKTDSLYSYNVSLIGMGDGRQTLDTSGVNMRYTYGLNSSFDHHRWGLNLEAYGQNGTTIKFNQSGNPVTDTFQTVKAYMFSVNPWIKPFKNFTVGAGLDYLSGTNTLDTANNDVTNVFSPQFGAGDKFYGKIDIFVNIPSDTRNGGLIDGYLTLRYDYQQWAFGAAYHYYALQNNVQDVENPGKALSKPLGTELDLSAIKDLTKDVNINTGVAIFFPTRSMEFVKASAFSQIGSPPITAAYFYVMLTFHPVFFSK